MGNSDSAPRQVSNNILVHSFQLDADTDYCSLPCCCCRGKQPMFHVPQSFNHHLTKFLSYNDGVMLIRTLNKILSKTAFPNKPCSPCVLITLILPWLCILPIWYFTYSIGILSEMDSNQLSSFFPELSEVGINTDKDVEDRSEQKLTTFLIVLITVTIIVGLCIPFTIYFCFQCIRKSERKRKLLKFLRFWNSKRNDGVFVALGGHGRTPRGVTIGTQNGADYNSFYLATWDPTGVLVQGFLHVIVNCETNADWCQRNGVRYISPVPFNQQAAIDSLQQSQARSQSPAGYTLVPNESAVNRLQQSQDRFQPPAGYTLVPEESAAFQVPEGFELVPVSENHLPTYEEAKQMP